MAPVCRCQGARTSKLMLEGGVQIPGSLQSCMCETCWTKTSQLTGGEASVGADTTAHPQRPRLNRSDHQSVIVYFPVVLVFSPRSSWKMWNTPSVSLTVSVWQRTHSLCPQRINSLFVPIINYFEFFGGGLNL